jgi:hypothetical protein
LAKPQSQIYTSGKEIQIQGTFFVVLIWKYESSIKKLFAVKPKKTFFCGPLCSDQEFTGSWVVCAREINLLFMEYLQKKKLFWFSSERKHYI